MGYGRLAREFSQCPPAILQTNYVIKLRHPATEKRNPTPHIPASAKRRFDRRLANNDPGRPCHGFRLSERLCLLFGQAASLCGAPDDGDPVSAQSAALRRRLAQAARQQEGHRFAWGRQRPERDLVALRQAPRGCARPRPPAPSSEFQSMSFAAGTNCAPHPSRSATSRTRCELKELAAPTTITATTCRAAVLTASGGWWSHRRCLEARLPSPVAATTSGAGKAALRRLRGREDAATLK
jgi:hypothetical protein